ncbi:hypothetical protein ATANTOWER_018566 [Ataeniobius toweri]|uniref:Uncharacterized protein n=1 Tax=Ataeniobius toweri TaxID=208326 RepID=A0ABU7AQV1_9TELE|nr:hypothetical protein [Ataeniobius toweri]
MQWLKHSVKRIMTIFRTKTGERKENKRRNTGRGTATWRIQQGTMRTDRTKLQLRGECGGAACSGWLIRVFDVGAVCQRRTTALTLIRTRGSRVKRLLEAGGNSKQHEELRFFSTMISGI